MNTNKKRRIKPETDDPIKEAIDHPNGPSLTEMIYGKEDEETSYTARRKELKKDKGDNDRHVIL